MLKHSGMVKTAVAATAMELAMSSHESAMIRDIRSYVDGAAAEDITVTIDNVSIMQFIAVATWQLLSQGIAGTLTSILDAVRAAGLFAGIPLGAGQTLNITAAETNDFMEIDFDLYDEQDIKPSMKNGSASSIYQLFQIISNPAVVLAAGDVLLSESDLADLWPQFPGGAVVPAQTRMHLLALFGGPCGVGKVAGTTQHTSRLKMIKDRADILSRDLLGMMFLGDNTVATNTVSYLSRGSPIQIPVAGQDAKIKVFDPPVIFEPGQELNVYATVVEDATGGDMAIGELKLGLLFDVEKL